MREIELSKGDNRHKNPQNKGKYVALVDDEDFEYLNGFNWTLKNSKGIYYAQRFFLIDGRKKIILMHRFVMNPPKGLVVDHIDGDGLNNKKSNLRLATISQNMCNSRRDKNTRSKYIGVDFFHPNGGMGYWRARVHKDGKTLFNKTFNTEIEAAMSRDLAAIEYHGEFARLNFERGVLVNG